MARFGGGRDGSRHRYRQHQYRHGTVGQQPGRHALVEKLAEVAALAGQHHYQISLRVLHRRQHALGVVVVLVAAQLGRGQALHQPT